MDLDVAAAEGLRSGGVDIVGAAGDIVVDDGAVARVPDLDAERVSAVGRVAMNRNAPLMFAIVPVPLTCALLPAITIQSYDVLVKVKPVYWKDVFPCGSCCPSDTSN